MTSNMVTAVPIGRCSFLHWCSYVVAGTFLTVNSTALQLTDYKPVRSFNGSSCCAVDTPSYTWLVDNVGIPANVPGAVQCAYYCSSLNSTDGCTGFNYVEQGLTAECRFYKTPPTDCYSTTIGCAYYEVRFGNDGPTLKLVEKVPIKVQMSSYSIHQRMLKCLSLHGY
jgi:hypothetical protein